MEGKKRSRNEEESVLTESKRLHISDEIIEILDGDVICEDVVDSGLDLDDVIRSLQAEIATASPSASPQLDLGYLLEASDDELGLPPSTFVSSSSPSSSDGGVAAVEVVDGFDRMWGFEDDVYDPVSFDGFEIGWNETEFVEDVTVDDGLFSYGNDDELLTWRTESLPAL